MIAIESNRIYFRKLRFLEHKTKVNIPKSLVN